MFIKLNGQPEPESNSKALLDPHPATGGTQKANKSRWPRIMGLLCVYTIMSLMVVKVASTAALYQQQQLPNLIEGQTLAETTPSTESDDSSQAQAAERLNIDKMRAKLQQLQHEQQLQYRLQQQQMQLHLQQMHQQQMHLHANDVESGEAESGSSRAGGGGVAGETAYLLERADDVAPIYGTWRTKARRPQPPGNGVQHATAMQLNVPGDGVGDGNDANDNHLYERLPKRSVTMTPLRDALRDQLPRPPRLSTQRPPSVALLRRQYSETPGTLALRDDFKPKPFHFPFDGPLPEQFKKGEAERQHGALNNIQDILHNMHINNAMPSKMPGLVMMPTGLHIAGSYKNLKASGIANFFRGKRNKKQMQLSIPLPMFPMGMPMPLYAGAPHQRVAIEQLYPYKPRSPQDINLLALQQAPASKPNSKKKHKKQQQQQQQEQSNYNMLLEHGSQQHFMVDPFLQSFPPIIALNATRQPQHKRIPFKVNLDIYPVLPPSRPTSVLRNPFQSEYAVPSAGALTASPGSVYAQPQLQMQQSLYQTPFKFPTQPPSHLPMIFPDQSIRYSQHQAIYQSPKFLPQTQSQQADDCIYAQHGAANGNGNGHGNENGNGNGNGNSGSVESSSNQIMLHLNVFPKQKSSLGVRASTNPFYNHNFSGLQRNIFSASEREREQPLPKPPSPIEPRQVAGSQSQASNSSLPASTAAPQPQQQQQQQQQNQTQQQQQQSVNHSISRSDNLSLIDFEHPIVAAEVPQLPQLPHAAALTGHPGLSSNHGRLTVQGEHYRYHKNSHIDQLAAEAQTASLFRFPVEDLIQFQVDDAL